MCFSMSERQKRLVLLVGQIWSESSIAGTYCMFQGTISFLWNMRFFIGHWRLQALYVVDALSWVEDNLVRTSGSSPLRSITVCHYNYKESEFQKHE